MDYLISGLMTLIIGLLSFVIQSLIKDNKRLRENRKEENLHKEEGIKNGLVCLLRIQIIEYHNKYVPTGRIPSYVYDSCISMNEAYHRLGGNGLVGHMIDDIKNLEIERN